MTMRSTVRWLYEQTEDAQRFAREIREVINEIEDHAENALVVQRESGALLTALTELDASLERSKDALLQLWRSPEKAGMNDGN